MPARDGPGNTGGEEKRGCRERERGRDGKGESERDLKAHPAVIKASSP